MYCEHCGTQITEESKFCPQCGQSHSSENPPQPPVVRKRRWWPWVLTILLLILLALYWIGNEALVPRNIILSQLESLREGQLTEAYYDYTSKDFQKTTPLDTFKKYIKTTPALENATSFILENESTEGTISTIRGYIVSKDGTSMEAVYKLIFEDDRWKILSFSPVDRESRESPPQTSVTKQMLEPVESFLGMIQKPEFKELYPTNLTKTFLQNTPYDRFDTFIAKNPILATFSDYEIIDHQLIRGRGELYIMLNPEQEEIPAAFTVIKEDGSWKIFRLSIGAPKDVETLQTTELFETQLIPFVKTGIEQLKNKNFDQFHQESVSKEFQADVTVALLQELVQEYPLLSRYTELAVKERGESGDLAWMDIEFKKGSDSWVIEFTLGKDPDDWRILGMRMSEFGSTQ